jgi:para-aminobenzoate synthetase component I
VTLAAAEPAAHLGGLVARNLVEVSHDPRVLDHGGRWAVAVPYDGPPVLARFADWQTGPPEVVAGSWQGPTAWTTSLDRSAYMAAVETIRERIAAGGVYQANVCRVLSARLPDPARGDVGGLHALLCRGNPAPHAAMIRIPGVIEVASASPELFLDRVGDVVETGPIKGTGRTVSDLLPKDRAENVMIVDLMRNDLSRVCRTGSVTVPALLTEEEHPGLVHLVSRVRGVLRDGTTWPQILEATFPPGSVTGAPKLAAIACIDEVEAASRGVYCGALGWVDADAGTASLGVAIRTFWVEAGQVRFGTGAGITWSSDPEAEWRETELKAERLIAVAAGSWEGRMDP